MSLVAGRGPFGQDPAGWFSPPVPAQPVYVEPHPRRIQALVDGRPVIDTERALMVHRLGHPLSYAFPADEVDELPARAGAGGTRVRARAVGCGRRLDRGGSPTGALSAEPLSPGRLPPDDARPARLGRRCRPGRHHRHRHRLRDVTGSPAVRGARIGTDGPAAPPRRRRATATTRGRRRTGPPSSGTPWSRTWPGATRNRLPETTQIKGFLSFDATRCDVIAELPARPPPRRVAARSESRLAPSFSDRSADTFRVP